MKDSRETISPELKKVAQKFRQLRIDSGYNSQEIFAYDKEINRVQYWRVEKGSNITLATFFKLLEIHKITPEEFFKDFS
ncbi:XRE family transcriptional regulator [Flavobacterium sp. LB2P53]|uniref:XRE family transcriptional regulator n=1 Tax=Flavobacterium sp. LB2P53 TaxID=2497481 RepID=UPI000F82D5DB|nr:XRE family transcriptional regulator [Flavobacterium sp. LB2P53]RTY69682.1 XRE family transcriptional regulator [Flavobacterium sp. LB2P53]